MSDDDFIDELKKDYGKALFHLCWMECEGFKGIIFGFLELYAKEIKQLCSTRIQEVKSKGCKGAKIYFSRFEISCQNALDIYKKAMDTNVFLIPSKKGESKKKISISKCMVEPRWPNLTLEVDLPYLQDWAQYRCSHLFTEQIEEDVLRILKNEKDKTWIDERLLFPISEYGELIGSLHLVAQNPVYRKLRGYLYEHEGKERVHYQFELREGQDLTDVQVFCFEERFGGFINLKEFSELDDEFDFDLLGATDKVGKIVVSKRKGILEVKRPTGFLKKIQTTISRVTEKLQVRVPNSRGDAKETYSVIKKINLSETVEGKPSLPAVENIKKSRLDRKKLNLAKKLDQFCFDSGDLQSAGIIRSLIRDAKKEVYLIDAYFRMQDMRAFCYAAELESVKFTVVTSAECLRNKDNVLDKEAGQALSGVLSLGACPNVDIKVMNGDKSPIHDRFLVIDGNVWLLGSSFGSLGKRFGMMIKVPNPDPVLEKIKKIINGDKSENFESWIKK